MSGAGPFSPVSQRTVAELLREGLAAHPDRTLLVNEDPQGAVTSFSWREVIEHSAGVAARLAAAGAEPGDRVHLHLTNRPEFLFAWFGAALSGLSIVPTNTNATAAEIGFIAGHAEAKVSLTEESHMQTVEEVQAESGVPVLCCERDRLLEATAADPGAANGPEDELGIIYTSGTTSRPKGAIVTNANYLYVGEVYAKATALTPVDRLLVALPLFHANAQYYSTMGALTARATIILVPYFSASRYLHQCTAHGATIGSLFSAPIRMILAQDPAARTRDHSLRAVFFAQNLSEDELDRWERQVGAPLAQMYGMTETIGPPLMNPIWGVRKHHTVGRVTLGYQCRVVDEEGRDLGPGERGELWVGGVLGVSLIAGYLHDEEATAAAMGDGWLRTGDVVAVDEDGYFAFVDRSKDMIKRSGENVAAGEVEAVLLDHPAVAEVAVVGVPDQLRDEAIVAFVVPAGEGASAAELIEWCAARLAKFRVPSQVATVGELPRTPVGKIQKHLLRAEYLDSGR